MILSGKEIQRQIGLGNIVIDPFSPKQLNPNSYNLRLNDTICTYEKCNPGYEMPKNYADEYHLDPKKENPTQEYRIPSRNGVLLPGKLYLARTMEYTETHNFIPQIEARSSIARLGISIHQTAGFGDVGFKGCWTLEISCIHPVAVYPGMEICQIIYHTIQGEYEPYNGKYQNNRAAQASMMHKEYA
ncbi:dCTP deaminase [Clostridia bacterium]|nr:dCTP deaminase [Clostridia bacterium]